MSKTALVLVDIQNDYFEGGNWPVHKMQQVSENAARLLERARNAGDTVIHVHHESLAENAPFFRPGTPGAEIHASVAPKDGEKLILKHKPNSFHKTSLHEDLQAGGITDVVVCGAMSQMCIDATARAAADFGYTVTVVEDACGAKEQSFNNQDVAAPLVHAAFMAALGGPYARVVGIEDFMSGSD